MELEQASREELLAIIAQLQARIEELERRLGRSGGKGMPGLKPKGEDPAPKKERKRRAEGCGRERGTPPMIVSHAMDRCPQCDIALVGGSVKRTREVIELAPSPVQISQHQYLERRGPLCGKRWVPQPELADQVLGQGRFGIELISLIATLRKEGRLPVRMVQ
jgi:hypothetical protein